MKYQRFAPYGCKGIEIRRFEFVTKTQFLLKHFPPLDSSSAKEVKTETPVSKFNEFKPRLKLVPFKFLSDLSMN